MAWTNPTLRTTGDVVSVSVWNVDVIENLSFLGSQHDHNGDNGDGGTTALSVPSGLIAIFDTSCPTGWTRVSAFDNNLLKASTSYGTTGGATTHTHSYNITDWTSADIDLLSEYSGYPEGPSGDYSAAAMGYSILVGNEFLMFPYGSSGVAGPVHSIAPSSGTPTTWGSGLGGLSEPYPSYIEVIFCKKD